MKHIKCFCLTLVVFLLIIGCSRNYAIKKLPESESKAIQQELIDNWQDYTIYTIRYQDCAVFDPKNDDRKILVGPAWDTIQDQDTWSEFMEVYITSDGVFSVGDYRYQPTIVQEIWGPDNQLYGFVIYTHDRYAITELVDKNTLRFRAPYRGGGGSLLRQ